MNVAETLFGLGCLVGMSLAIFFFWHPIPERCASAFTISEIINNMFPMVLIAPFAFLLKGIFAAKEVKK